MLMMGKALILTNGKFDSLDAKTAHGLIRGTMRFKILGVIDHLSAGKDAGLILDGRERGIPIYASLREFSERSDERADYAVIGVAVTGGRLTEDWNQLLLDALENRLSIVSGMHRLLSENPLLKEAAERNGVRILDIRRPKPTSELQFWTGEIYKVKAPILAVLGTDCAIGKRTTCRILLEMCREAGIKAEMIYTGQTGWLQGLRYGFILDATLNDFVSGELERAILECDREAAPDLVLLEGQSGLRNPSGPCGAELLLSANAKGVILQHAPFRTYFDELEHFGCLLPDLEDEIDLIRKYGAKVLAVTLNEMGGIEKELEEYRMSTQAKLALPVLRPLKDGPEAFLPIIRFFMENQRHAGPAH
jgi:uncharacterized NAD-dependent epimerase/dehydratase family protein